MSKKDEQEPSKPSALDAAIKEAVEEAYNFHDNNDDDNITLEMEPYADYSIYERDDDDLCR